MDEIARILGSLEANQSAMMHDIQRIRDDIEDLKSFKWKLVGLASVLVIGCEAVISIIK